jgi:gamma-glutamylcyclotransferase (GGCT)/AIG2-like uncharacterized protein YtfP
MSGPHTAFFYGTLMAPEVFFTAVYGTSKPPDVIRQLHTFRPAILHGYCRHRVRYADYPAIVPEEGQSVRGVFATGLTDANVDKLDHFEGSEYRKELVRLRLLVKGENGNEKELVESGREEDEMEAQVYVFKDRKGIELGEWDFDHFLKERLKLWSREEFVFNGE